jgi:hypothetical protein
MNPRVALLRRAAPGLVKKRLLDELARATAAGFGSAPPQWTGGSLATRLQDYARFTADQAERALGAGDESEVEAVKRRLRSESTELGTKVRRWLGLKCPADVAEAMVALYGHIGIDMSASASGDVLVSRCLFAAHYSEPVCEVVAALDEGMAAGLSGGGRLEFFERITGGNPCCRARLDVGRPER